jgi:hypothetical protein
MADIEAQALEVHEDEKIKVTVKDAVVILTPYTWDKLKEQLTSVLPIVIYLLLFQLLVIRLYPEGALPLGIGIAIVILGLMFFMEGLRLGMMPFAENIGSKLPVKSPLPVVLGFAFMVGVGATLAEPAIGTLKLAGSQIDVEKAPLLYEILNNRSGLLVTFVGIGVGIAAALGILRFLTGWRLAYLIFPCVITTSILTIITFINPDTSSIIGLAWDCGAVTTGPVTVPLVLSLGIGVSAITSKGDSGMAGFGIVTLASLFPIMAVLTMGLILYYGDYVSIQAIIETAHQAAAAAASAEAAQPTIWDTPLMQATVLGFRAIVPLILFLYIFQRTILREGLTKPNEIMLGIFFTVFGMCLFNFGLFTGLSPLGAQVGSSVPLAFHPPETALYGTVLGKVIAVLFGFVMGYGATLAEPALNALGMKVEEITIGAFKKKLLMHAVAGGVAVGIGLGVVKFIFDIPLIYMLLPSYALLLFLTAISKESYVNIGWDSAGVTTGPITVPLVIAMGLGIGQTIGIAEGFGILSLASVCPILSVLTLGLLVTRAHAKAEAAEKQEAT